MQSALKVISLGLLIPGALTLSLGGCHKEGPAEKAGEKIDNTLGTNDTKADGPFEKAGESVDDATQNKQDK